MALQHRAACGGCSINAALGAPLMGLGGAHLWVWKLLPLAWGVATLLAGAWAARRLAGPAAGWAVALLLCLPPTGLVDVSLMAWGGPAEAGLWALVALGVAAAPPRSRRGGLALGLLMGLGIWASRAAAPGLLVAGGLAWRRGARPGALLGGLALGLSATLLPASWGNAGGEQLLFIGLTEMSSRAMSLLWPPALGPRLSPGSPAVAWLWVGAAGLALARLGWTRRWTLPAWAALTLGLFCLWGVALPPVDDRAQVIGSRYHAPWLLCLSVLLGVAVGEAWGEGRRRLAGALLLAGLATGGWGRAHRPPPYAGEVAPLQALPAFDLPSVALHVAGRVPEPRLRAAAERAPRLSLAHGMQLGLGVLLGTWSLDEALGSAKASARPGWALHGLGLALSGVEGRAPTAGPPELMRGVAQALGVKLLRRLPREGDPRRQLRAALRVACDGDEACPLLPAAGAVLVRACGGLGERLPPELLGCLGEASSTQPPALLEGAGWTLAGRVLDRPRRRALQEALTQDRGLERGQALGLGLQHPAAGLIKLITPDAHGEQPRRPYDK